MKNYNLIIWCAFVLERLGFYTLFPLDWNFAYQRMQNLDMFSLRTDFWGALSNLHSQPPLFNAFIGIVAIAVPESLAPIVIQTVFFGLAVVSFALYRRVVAGLIVSSSVKKACDIAYIVFPTILFAERWFTYTFPVMAMLIALSYLLLRFSTSGRLRFFVGFAVVATALVLTRGFFHVVAWMTPALVCAFWACCRRKFTQQMLIAAFALIVAVIPYCVNQVRHGMFTSSTWQGMNLFRTMHYITDDEIEAQIKVGALDKVCALRSFAAIESYQSVVSLSNSLLSCHRVLDQREKSSSREKLSGEVNWNHRVIPPASLELQKGWRTLVRRYPTRYLKSVMNGVYAFFTVDVYRFWDNYDEWLPSRSDSFVTIVVKSIKAFCIPIVLLLLFVASSVAYFRFAICGKQRFTSLFVVGTIFYVFGISVTCELGETCIMRVPIDPFLLIGFFAAVDQFLSWRNGGTLDLRHVS